MDIEKIKVAEILFYFSLAWRKNIFLILLLKEYIFFCLQTVYYLGYEKRVMDLRGRVKWMSLSQASRSSRKKIKKPWVSGRISKQKPAFLSNPINMRMSELKTFKTPINLRRLKNYRSKKKWRALPVF